MSDESDDKLSAHDRQKVLGDFDRRGFLKVLGAAFSTAVLPDVLSGCASDESLPRTLKEVEELTARQTISVVRPEDHLILTLGLVNLKRSPAGQLVTVSSTLPAYIVVDFPAQAIVEQPNPAAPYFSPSWLSGGTRLIFQLPSSYAPVPWSLASLLELCSTCGLLVATPLQKTIAATVSAPATAPAGNVPAFVDGLTALQNADSDPLASARKMTADGTLAAIAASQNPYKGTGVLTAATKPSTYGDGSFSLVEAPYRLQLSPNTMAGWAHATSPVVGQTGAMELWHTRLGARTVATEVAGPVDERNAYLRTMRALWARDRDLNAPNAPTPSAPAIAWNPSPVGSPGSLQPQSVRPDQRSRIVDLTTAADGAQSIQVNRLMLSSLGATLDAHGEWNDTTVASWIHKMAGGRENFVQVTSLGTLLPFGNSVSKLSITRRNDDANQATPIGTLLAYDVFVIHGATTTYRTSDFQQLASQNALLLWPFVSVQLTQATFVARSSSAGADYWPVDLSGAPIFVPAIGIDQRGRSIHFAVPLYFVPGALTAVSSGVAGYRSALATGKVAAPNPYKGLDVPMAGQRIAYAYSRRDDTTYPTRDLYFDLTPTSEAGFPYLPVVTGAVLDVEAVQPYTGGAPVTVTYHARYAANGAGFDTTKNKSQLLFSLASPVTADLTQQSGGNTGFLAPSIAFTALSRLTGPSHDFTLPSLPNVPTDAGSLLAAVDGGFDPASYLSLVAGQLDKIRILGVFSLIDIVKAVDPNEAATDMAGLVQQAEQAALKYAPKFVTEGLSEVEKILSVVAEVKAEIETIWTNAQELLGSQYVQDVANAVDNPGAAVGSAVTGAIQRLEQNPQLQAVYQAVKTKLTDIVTKAKVFYKTLLAAIQHIENLEILALAGSPPPADGSLPQLIANGMAVKDAIVDLANYGARAALDAKQAVTAAANKLTSVVNGRVRALDTGADAGAGDLSFSVNNTPIQISQGLTTTFLAKMKDLEDAIGDVSDVPALVQRVTNIFDEAQQAVTAVRDLTVKISWQPKIGSWFLPDTNWLIFRPATQHGLTLAMEARTKSSGDKKAGLDVNCRLDQFDLCLGRLDAEGNSPITVQFDHLAFAMSAGSAPTGDVKMNGIKFGGDLSFLETLRKLIPTDPFAGSPSGGSSGTSADAGTSTADASTPAAATSSNATPQGISVDASGIHAGYTFHIPNVAIGIFSVENISLSLDLEIPFVSSGGVSGLTFKISFCDKDHPFLITVGGLGGGGYFVATLSAKGVESLEVSLSVGAQVAFSVLGLAQGSLSILVNIAFTVKNTDAGAPNSKDILLTASLRLHGELDVMGIVSVSIDVTLLMSYDFTSRTLVAEGKITIDVSLLVFSVHKDIDFRRTFSACNNDPTLRELMPPGVDNVSQYWTDYCNAYAA